MTGTTGMTGGISVAARRLLRGMRDLMAGEDSAQGKLDRIVALIADEMGAEVCSIYVLRPGRVLELFATRGLNPDAVHRTKMRVGQGIVGDVAANARPLVLSDAQMHPSFSYQPETGEDPYRSMMAVPVIRSGRVRGVLAVQNEVARHYTDEEMELTETIAMVVAELVTTGDFAPAEDGDDAAHARQRAPANRPDRLSGRALVRGQGMGQAVLHRAVIPAIDMVSDDPEAEAERLDTALEAMRAQIDEMILKAKARGPGEHGEILETYRMFAGDHGWVRRLNEGVKGGLSAEAAVLRVIDETRAKMRRMTDPYFRERLADMEDLNNRLLSHLTGGPFANATPESLPDKIVLFATTLGPAELLDYDPDRLAGLVLEEGSSTSHVAIVARSLGVPVVAQIEDALSKVRTDEDVIINADHGQVLLRPPPDVVKIFATSMRIREQRKLVLRGVRHLPSVTLDGVAIDLNINAGLLIDIPQLAETGASGVGLYRTEIPFMVQGQFPSVERQTEIYREVIEQAGDKPVTFRTLDIGGDKVLPYDIDGPEEHNPAMGWRAIRIGLDKPAVLRTQLRAMISAAAGRELRVMFPMITTVDELISARALLDRELDRATLFGTARPETIHVGVMLEVPSLIWQLPALLERVDFVSVGTNDLMQFLFAADRMSPELHRRYDTLCPSALAALRQIMVAAHASDVPVSICGEMAGRPLEAMALIGIGARRLSMAPQSVGSVKSMLCSLNAGQVTEYLGQYLSSPAPSLRKALTRFARDNGVVLEDTAIGGQRG
ncbi:MAG: phosphoenolpyruvate--protein phosphotransferase [Alphaproteobacteria bacterium]